VIRQQRVVVARRERHHVQLVRMRVDDGQRAAADRSGRAEDREALHISSFRNT
jgi:hypothetical protein